MDAYDSDVLIYAATADHPLGIPVRAHLDRARGVGSTLLLPELLAGDLLAVQRHIEIPVEEVAEGVVERELRRRGVDGTESFLGKGAEGDDGREEDGAVAHCRVLASEWIVNDSLYDVH